MTKAKTTSTVIKFALSESELIKAICDYIEDKNEFAPFDCVSKVSTDENNTTIIEFTYESDNLT